MDHEKFLQYLKRKASNYNEQDKKRGRLLYNHKYECWNYPLLEAKDILKILHEKGVKCYYCKRTLSYTSHIKFKNSLLTLDRLNNDLPHIVSNCVPCCYFCNTTRSNAFTAEKFKQIKNRK